MDKKERYCEGILHIDTDNGVITFISRGIRVLRITHLPDPIPANVSIDMAALPALTSYTPLASIDMSDIDEATDIMQELGPE